MTARNHLPPPFLAPLEPLPTDQQPSGTLHRPVRAILFDVYGTLFISGSGDIGPSREQTALLPAVEKILRRFRRRESARILLDKFYREIENTHIRLKQAGRDYPEVDIERIWQAVLGENNLQYIREFAWEFELAVNPVWPMPRAGRLLAAIARQNFTAGIISNAQFYTDHLFELFWGEPPAASWADPALVWYSYQHGYAKPSLYLFEQASAALAENKIEPGQVLFVGNDMRNDIFPARKCGFQTALFAGDARSLRLRREDPCCRGLSPELVITELSQLEKQLTNK